MNATESSVREVIQAMIDRLKARREFEPEGCVTTVRELAEQAAPEASDQTLLAALGSKAFQAEVASVDMRDVDAPIALKQDIERLASSELTLEYLKRHTPHKDEQPYLVGDLKSQIRGAGKNKATTALKQAFEKSIRSRIASGQVQDVAEKEMTPVQAMSTKLLKVLKSQRSLGEKSYPLPLRRLAELAEVDIGRNTKTIFSATNSGPFKKEAMLARKDMDAPLALREDVEQLAASDKTLLFALRTVRTNANPIQTVAKIGKKLTSSLEFNKRFNRLWNQKAREGQLPPGVAGVAGQSVSLFLIDDLLPASLRERLAEREHSQPVAPIASRMEPVAVAAAIGQSHHDGDGGLQTQPQSAPRPSSERPASDGARLEAFATQFSAAFSRLDHQRGGYNLVSLADLRDSLPGYSREQFDASLRELRKQGLYSLSEGQSKHGIPQQERDAGIWEAGNLLVYASRRTS